MAEIRVNTTGTLKLFDADDSHSAGIAAGTITADATLMTLNTADIDISVPIDVTGASTITTDDNSDNLTLISTDADSTSGPNFRLRRDSSSPADDDNLGNIFFSGDNSAGNETNYAAIKTVASDVTDGTEDGYFNISVANGGSLDLFFGMTGAETVINDLSKNHNFRVESNDNANMLFVDGGNNRVGIGTASPATQLHVANTGGIELRLDADTDNSGQEDCFIKFSTDGGGQLGIAGMDNNNSSTLFSGNTENAMVFGTVSSLPVVFATNNTERMQIDSSGNTRIGTTSNYDGEILRANVDGTNNIAAFTSSNNGGAGQVTITNSFSAGSSTDENATLRFGLGNGGSGMRAFKVSDTQTAANRDVGLQFFVQQNNAEAVKFQIADNGDLTATDTSIGSISDVRLKKDIEDLTYSIDTFKALKPRTFNWKNPWLHAGETNRRGFVAQELKEVDPYWVGEQKAVKKPDDVLDPATYYEEGDEIPEDKKIGDLKTEATYTYQYEKGDGSDYDLLNDGSELDNIEMIAKLGKKDAMYISVIQQLITRIEALEG